MSQRVRIGCCSNPVDAALVRSVMDAHGIHAVIGAEHHAGLFAGFGGGFLRLDIFVPGDQAEEASALLADLRAGEREQDAIDEADEHDEHDHSAEASPADPELVPRLDRRRRIAITVALALCVQFGTGHLYTRAWLRGLSLAALEVIGFSRFGHDPRLGVSCVLIAVVLDLVGAVWRARTAIADQLPRARVVT